MIGHLKGIFNCFGRRYDIVINSNIVVSGMCRRGYFFYLFVCFSSVASNGKSNKLEMQIRKEMKDDFKILDNII